MDMDQIKRERRTKLWKRIGWMVLLGYAAAVYACAQSSGPITTPAINKAYYYVGTSPYTTTIQSAVTAACNATSHAGMVFVPPGISPTDNPLIQNGCTGVFIQVQTAPAAQVCYEYSTSTTYVVGGTCPGGGGSGVNYIAPGPNVTCTPLSGGHCVGNVTVSATGGGSSGTSSVLVSQPTPASTTLLQALNNAANQNVALDVIADSFWICDYTNCPTVGPVISTNRKAEQIRLAGQTQYGNGGTGMYPLVDQVSSTPAPLNPEAWSCTTYDTNNDFSTASPGPNSGGFSGVVHIGAGGVCTFNDSRNIAYTGVSLYYATPATGTSSLAIVADGTTSMGAATSGSATVTGYAGPNGTTTLTTHRYDSSTTLSSGPHSITFTCSGNCYLYAAQGRNAAGFSLSNLAVGGGTAGEFGGANAAAQLAFSDLEYGGQQGAIFAMYTNQPGDPNCSGPSGLQTCGQTIVTHEQGLASTPTVMVEIPPVGSSWASSALAATYTAALNALASANSLTSSNIQSRGTTVGGTAVGWGTAYNAASGLWNTSGGGSSAPGVHPNDKGNLDEAQLDYAAFINATSSNNGGITGTLTTGKIPVANGAHSVTDSPCDNGVTLAGTVTCASDLATNSADPSGPVIRLYGSAAGSSNYFFISGSAAFMGGTALQGTLLLADATAGSFLEGWYRASGLLNVSYSELQSDSGYCWANGTSLLVNQPDTCMWREAAGVMDFGNAVLNDKSGTIKTNVFDAGTGIRIGGTATNTHCLVGNGTNYVDAVCPGSSGLSGMTAGQVPIAATATTVTSSMPLSFGGTNITTGIATTTSGDLPIYSNTTGAIADSTIQASAVVTLTGSQTLTNKSIAASQINSGAVSVTNGGTGQDLHTATGVMQVNAGTVSASTALANGTTATTQSPGDNTTKVATTAYVLANAGGTPAYPQTVSGCVSGGVLYGSLSTQVTCSPAGTANVLMKWGGPATAPQNSLWTDNGTTSTYTGTGGTSQVLSVTTGSGPGADITGVGAGAPGTTGWPTNYAGFIGPASGTPAYVFQHNVAAPTVTSYITVGVPVGSAPGVSAVTYTAVPVSSSVTVTPGSGVTSVTCATAACTSLRGTYTIVGGTFTTGTVAALAWTATPAAYVCTATMNGGTGFLGVGNSVATTTGMNITVGVTVATLTFSVNYSCQP